MYKIAASFLLLTAAFALAQGPAPGETRDEELTTKPAGGGVVAVGGGTLPDRIYKRILDLSGRKNPRILILPLATAEPDTAGSKTALRFKECGGPAAEYVYFQRDGASKPELLDKIRDANIVYFPGGDQKRILEIVKDTPAENAIRDVLAKGGVVGGTSAGCEVLGDLSLTGKSRLDLAVVGSSGVEPGLSLVSGVLFDQHFLRRGRFLRLLSATLDAKKKIGVGVDESTAAVFPHGTRTLEVIGERQVTIFRIVETTKTALGESGDFARAANVNLHILAEGDRYELDRDRAILKEEAVKAPAETARDRGDDDAPAASSPARSAPAKK